jgi:predicted tellurium resistance membrane protein TerC
MISASAQRVIYRWVHIILAIPVIGYVYSPFEQLPDYAPVVRYIAVPVLAVTGLCMWKGHLLRRLFRTKSAGHGLVDMGERV